VLAGVLLITLVALAAFDVAAVGALRRYLLGRTDSNLTSVVHMARPVTAAVPVPARRRWTITLPPGERYAKAARPKAVKFKGPLLHRLPPFLDQYYLAYVGRNQRRQVLVHGNPKLVPAATAWTAAVVPTARAWTAGGTLSRTVRSAHGNLELRVLWLPERGGALVATTSMSEVNKTVGQLRLILIIGSAAAALLVCGGVIMVLRRGLRPIEAMAAQADRITAGDLTDRVDPRDPRTEVGRLSTALNGMLARIETSVAERAASQEATRQFFADASHELRTPLASLRANAELYQQGALTTKPQVDEAMRRITLESQRMGRLVDDMLRLARLDQHPGQEAEPVDLSGLLAACAERNRVANQGHRWQVRIEPGLASVGDEELLRRAVDNLLANVAAHTPEGTTGTLAASREGDAVIIEVSDDGPGVEDEKLPRIFDRFYRGSGGRSGCPGSGLGLAIVSAVVAAHGGTARASAVAPHGLAVTVSIPDAASQPSTNEAEHQDGQLSLFGQDGLELGERIADDWAASLDPSLADEPAELERSLVAVPDGGPPLVTASQSDPDAVEP
jgi:two-component system OmpR family sensor kinase